MAVYLVDYENVHQSGLTGIETLSTDDLVVIFYSYDGAAVPVYVLDKCTARLDYRRVVTGTTNALDFQLVAFLFHEMQPEEDYYIISHDKGYDMVVPMAKSFGNTIIRKSYIGEDDAVWENSFEYKNIQSKMILFQKKDINEKIKNICGIYGIKNDQCIGDPDKEDVSVTWLNIPLQEKIAKVIKEKVGTTPANETVQLLIQGLAGCENRQDFYLFCTRNMGSTAGHKFYKAVKTSFEEMVTAVRQAS